jgi:hypothetical protein
MGTRKTATSSKAQATGERASAAKAVSGSNQQGAATAPDLASRYTEAYHDLAQGLNEGMTKVQAQQSEAYAAFEKVREDIQSEALSRASEAYQNYVKSAQGAPQSEQGQKQLEEAYHNYMATLTGLQEQAVPKLQQAYQEMESAVSRIATDAQSQSREQYVEYLRRLQQAWANVDVSRLI